MSDNFLEELVSSIFRADDGVVTSKMFVLTCQTN